MLYVLDVGFVNFRIQIMPASMRTGCMENGSEDWGQPTQKMPKCINATFLDCYNLAQIFCYMCLYDRK